MTLDTIKNTINQCVNDVYFTYNGKPSGITSTVDNYIPTFQVWHGNDMKEYKDIDAVVTDRFYSGKSIIDLLEVVDFKIA